MNANQRKTMAGGDGPVLRWSLRRKREAVLRLLRGEPVDALSRELGVEIHRLEAWREKALRGLDEILRERDGDPLQAEFDEARFAFSRTTGVFPRGAKPRPLWSSVRRPVSSPQ